MFKFDDFFICCVFSSSSSCSFFCAQKILDKMEADGLLEMPYEEPMFRFKFADAGNMAPPLISFSEVAFSYSGQKKDYLFRDISFGIHPTSRIVLVGPNGAGEFVFCLCVCVLALSCVSMRLRFSL